MSLKTFLLQFFTWWNGQTLGTKLLISRHGEFVGEDLFGNKYYRERNGDRRWVVYNGVAEASAIPPGWHGWLAHRTDVAPSQEKYVPKPWEKPHSPNMTGIAPRYLPHGSLANPEPRLVARPDYEPWTPE